MNDEPKQPPAESPRQRVDRLLEASRQSPPSPASDTLVRRTQRAVAEEASVTGTSSEPPTPTRKFGAPAYTMAVAGALALGLVLFVWLNPAAHDPSEPSIPPVSDHADPEAQADEHASERERTTTPQRATNWPNLTSVALAEAPFRLGNVPQAATQSLDPLVVESRHLQQDITTLLHRLDRRLPRPASALLNTTPTDS